MKVLTISLLICSTTLSFAQSDSVYLYTRGKVKIFPGYLVVFPKDDLYRVEQYMLVKGYFWMSHIHTFTAEKLAEETKHMTKELVPVCDSMVNTLRNSVYLQKEMNKLDSCPRAKLGYRNNFSWFRLIGDSKVRINQCAENYSEELKPELSRIQYRIDSTYKGKENLYHSLVDGSVQMDHVTMMNYLISGEIGELDYLIFEWLILNDTRNFVSVIEKMEENNFFIFTLALNDFPLKCNTENMKNTLKKLDFGGTRKDKLIKKIRTKRLVAAK